MGEVCFFVFLSLRFVVIIKWKNNLSKLSLRNNCKHLRYTSSCHCVSECCCHCVPWVLRPLLLSSCCFSLEVPFCAWFIKVEFFCVSSKIPIPSVCPYEAHISPRVAICVVSSASNNSQMTQGWGIGARTCSQMNSPPLPLKGQHRKHLEAFNFHQTIILFGLATWTVGKMFFQVWL